MWTAINVWHIFRSEVMEVSPEKMLQAPEKYEGMKPTGTVHPLGPFPVVKAGTFQDCNHQTGTYKLK